MSIKWVKLAKAKLTIFGSILKMASTVSCCGLFLLLMFDSYDKFANKRTTIGIGIKPFDLDKKQPPCLTICATEAYRKPGLFFKASDYIEQTFDRSDFFLDNFMDGFEASSIYNESMYSIEEGQSVYLGRCYTVCQKLAVSKNQNGYFIGLRKTRDVKGWFI